MLISRRRLGDNGISISAEDPESGGGAKDVISRHTPQISAKVLLTQGLVG
jgi:hypothetical protein